MTVLPDSPLSLWLSEAAVPEPDPPLEGDAAVDVAVVGGGLGGFAAACALLKQEPGLSVAVLEAKTAGYGASGRNGSFAMTVVGLGFGTTALLRGKRLPGPRARLHGALRGRARERHRRGAARLRQAPPGLPARGHDAQLREAVAQAGRADARSLGFDGISWLDAAATRAMVDSERYLGAMWEPRLAARQPGEAGPRGEAPRAIARRAASTSTLRSWRSLRARGSASRPAAGGCSPRRAR